MNSRPDLCKLSRVAPAIFETVPLSSVKGNVSVGCRRDVENGFTESRSIEKCRS